MFTNFLQLGCEAALRDYDIFPKVVPAGKTGAITIRPLGAHAAFAAGPQKLCVCPLDDGNPLYYPDRANWREFEVLPDADGCIRFSFDFSGEQMYFIRIGEKKLQLRVYAVGEDLVGRYPFRGDLHMHSCRSDGRQAPAIVCAEYRKLGYDFMAVTDHRRYEPSLEAIEAYKNVPIELTLVPGEEVHPPCDFAGKRINDVHIINFGGSRSVNIPAGREEAHWAEIEAYMRTIELPAHLPASERFAYASCLWVYNEIKKCGGLSLFCHPYWIANVYHVPPAFVDAMMERGAFGAFEVLGGESYYEQNGFQAAQYYQDTARGRRYPVVGVTDTHNAYIHDNRNALVASTLVFSPANEKDALIRSIEDFYSVAVDTIDETPRFVGEPRLVRYAHFLWENFFPLHDELCFEEGRAMKDYACGEPDAEELLRLISGRMRRQREKYFGW